MHFQAHNEQLIIEQFLKLLVNGGSSLTLTNKTAIGTYQYELVVDVKTQLICVKHFSLLDMLTRPFLPHLYHLAEIPHSWNGFNLQMLPSSPEEPASLTYSAQWALATHAALSSSLPRWQPMSCSTYACSPTSIAPPQLQLRLWPSPPFPMTRKPWHLTVTSINMNRISSTMWICLKNLHRDKFDSSLLQETKLSYMKDMRKLQYTWKQIAHIRAFATRATLIDPSARFLPLYPRLGHLQRPALDRQVAKLTALRVRLLFYQSPPPFIPLRLRFRAPL